MTDLQLFDPELVGATHEYVAPFTALHGEAEVRMFAPEGFRQFMLTGRLVAGAELSWNINHGDEGVYVISGSLETAGEIAGPRGAVLIEAGAVGTVRAVGDTEILHYGSTVAAVPEDGPFGAPTKEGRALRVFGPYGIGAIAADPEHPEEAGVRNGFYSDGSQHTSRIAMFWVAGQVPLVARSHSHSQDEIITVLSGEMRLGRHLARSGMSVAIPADRRYGFRTGPDWGFLNYRRDVAFMTDAPKAEPKIETITAR